MIYKHLLTHLFTHSHCHPHPHTSLCPRLRPRLRPRIKRPTHPTEAGTSKNCCKVGKQRRESQHVVAPPPLSLTHHRFVSLSGLLHCAPLCFVDVYGWKTGCFEGNVVNRCTALNYAMLRFDGDVVKRVEGVCG